ncbi:hypothetical protein GCM10010329_61440 [Streptomyces spiroverticillatus]|uniref:DUF2690 domain-containing protein n=1 Tax=Streptomyces finlayi TaxID=67296 RepID=A0A919CEM6_9ACTN|nr:DUF2690 domain-containing protein [Streptomyces finlayi]GHA29980.1 hypothetical protein GCM10010329_61440 [Streptomyces spiroverticillatus]GHD15167.1 hypothetical protein GCM10010334_75010 [Streptomyces finlayi]
MHTSRNALSAVALAAGLALGLLTAPTALASPPPPATAACTPGDARVVRSSGMAGPLVELLYSPSCRTAWGRVKYASPRDRVEVKNDLGARKTATVGSGASTAKTGSVNDANTQAWACVYTASGDTACTAAY